jgi:hypothetical protein
LRKELQDQAFTREKERKRELPVERGEREKEGSIVNEFCRDISFSNLFIFNGLTRVAVNHPKHSKHHQQARQEYQRYK